MLYGGHIKNPDHIKLLQELGLDFGEVVFRNQQSLKLWKESHIVNPISDDFFLIGHGPSEGPPNNPDRLWNTYFPALKETINVASLMKIRFLTIHLWVDRRFVQPIVINEKINALKRRRLAEEVGKMQLPGDCGDCRAWIEAARRVVLDLAAQGKIVVYDQPLPLEELDPSNDDTLAQFIVDEIQRLLAMGKIDIEADVEAAFRGDKRVLNDIRLLAESGYGEDNFGNNIPLPSELAYLRS